MLTGKALGDALQAAMTEKNVKQKVVAAEFGIRQPSVAGWIKTGRISKEHLTHLVEYFLDVVPPSHWGLPDTFGSSFAPPLIAQARASRAPASNSPYVRVPVLGEAAAGPGRRSDGDLEVVQHLEVLESWIRETLRENPSNLRVLTARGSSMSGLLEDGDVMFVVPVSSFERDGLYVLTVGDLLRVKRLRLRISDRLLSIESTDGSSPELVPLSAVGDTVLIQGRVVGSWGFKKA